MNALLADPTMRTFAACAAVLVLKMLMTANLTGGLRTRRQVFATPEDYRFVGKEPAVQRDETIERIRRAHLNDVENILPFLAIGFLYVLSAPSPTWAWWLMVLFTLSRLGHTAVYIAGVQPWRTLLFAIGTLALYLMTFSLLFSVL